VASKKREPVSLGSIVDSLFRPPATFRRHTIDDASWRKAVGANNVRRAVPIRLQDGVLLVRVASSSWAQQLSMLKSLVAERLAANGYEVRDIRFSVGVVQPPRRLLGIHVHISHRAPLPLPPLLSEQINQVPDPELREVIRRAAAINLTWQQAIRR
jgi:hypothetical protein